MNTQPTAPGWLAAAEQAHQEQQDARQARARRDTEQHAARINAQLTDLGIEPLYAASVDSTGNLRPAVLVDADPEQGTYEVHADWNQQGEVIELHTADWEARDPKFGRVRLLRSLADVAAARRETPTFPTTHNHHRTALRAMSPHVDHLSNGDVEAIVTAINGNTAALLHLADTLSRPGSTH